MKEDGTRVGWMTSEEEGLSWEELRCETRDGGELVGCCRTDEEDGGCRKLYRVDWRWLEVSTQPSGK